MANLHVEHLRSLHVACRVDLVQNDIAGRQSTHFDGASAFLTCVVCQTGVRYTQPYTVPAGYASPTFAASNAVNESATIYLKATINQGKTAT